MFLTIVGASPATQNPGGACSSYLVRQGETALVLDMGSGAFGRLQQHVAPDAVAAVVISHLHADHTYDLVPYRYFLAFGTGMSAAGRPRPRVSLLLPPGGHERLLQLIAPQDPSPTFFSDTFDVSEYDPAGTVTMGDLTLTFHAVQHIPHTYGIRVSGAGTLGYSADSGACDALRDVARDADLFLCENANVEENSPPMHLTPRQAATYARDGGARRLVLTHRWHVNDLDAAARQAAEIFAGPVSSAREGDTYRLAVD